MPLSRLRIERQGRFVQRDAQVAIVATTEDKRPPLTWRPEGVRGGSGGTACIKTAREPPRIGVMVFNA